MAMINLSCLPGASGICHDPSRVYGSQMCWNFCWLGREVDNAGFVAKYIAGAFGHSKTVRARSCGVVLGRVEILRTSGAVLGRVEISRTSDVVLGRVEISQTSGDLSDEWCSLGKSGDLSDEVLFHLRMPRSRYLISLYIVLDETSGSQSTTLT